jgi:signal transduction histidine kinase
LRTLLARVQWQREEERLRVAREIHDYPGQLLTAMTFDVRLMERKLAEVADPLLRDALAERLASTRTLLDEASAWAQKMGTELKSVVLDRVGLEAALEAESNAFAERAGVACDVRISALPTPASMETGIACFRIFQGILSNVAAHAHATRVAVTLQHKGGQIVLQVNDDGIGISQAALKSPTSLGLLEIRERARALGGFSQIQRAEPRGTVVTVTVPLDGKEG